MTLLNENNLASSAAYRVISANTDMYSRLRPSALLGFLIQSAIDSADNLGFGFGSLREQHLFWVLSRMTVELDETPLWNDTIEIETWPRDIERILYRRDYLIRKNGNIIGRATSSWLAIDLKSKKLSKVSEGEEWKFVTLRDKKAIEAAPAKLNAVSGADCCTIETQYNDFDLNGHVTSTRYLEWAENSMDTAFYKSNVCRGFSVNYIKETLPGENLGASFEFAENGNLFFEAKHGSSRDTSFRCLLHFKTIN